MGPIGLPFPAAPVATRQVAESPTRGCALRTDPPDAQLLVLPGEQSPAHAVAREAFRAEPSSRRSSVSPYNLRRIPVIGARCDGQPTQHDLAVCIC